MMHQSHCPLTLTLEFFHLGYQVTPSPVQSTFFLAKLHYLRLGSAILILTHWKLLHCLDCRSHCLEGNRTTSSVRGKEGPKLDTFLSPPVQWDTVFENQCKIWGSTLWEALSTKHLQTGCANWTLKYPWKTEELVRWSTAPRPEQTRLLHSSILTW